MMNSNIEKYSTKDNNINESNKDIQAKIFEATDDNIKKCADYIKSGGIVGMPTETVYGLAANAFDIQAVRKIFEFKGRPLSDPLIVHVSNFEMAKELINLDSETLGIVEKLSRKFWPGPLTIVLKANFNKISPILTANTDFIGIRYPKNDIAKKLIEFSGVPIAAPSANKFCHVSPVNPNHVFEDFKEFPVYILDGGVSNFCMESTVIKINFGNGEKTNHNIQILRMGAISKCDLENFAEEIYENNKNVRKFKIEFLQKEKAVPTNEEIVEKLNLIDLKQNDELEINQEAPGQFIKHYSPNVDTYIFEFDKNINDNNLFFLKSEDFEKCVVLDFKNKICERFSKDKFMKVYDLSCKGDSSEVMLNLYNFLRLAEKQNNPKYLLICNIEKYMSDNRDKFTLVDRVSKASSNRKIFYNN